MRRDRCSTLVEGAREKFDGTNQEVKEIAISLARLKEYRAQKKRVHAKAR
jgi:hypothetical protein